VMYGLISVMYELYWLNSMMYGLCCDLYDGLNFMGLHRTKKIKRFEFSGLKNRWAEIVVLKN